MHILRTLEDAAPLKGCVLVPTMGYLHKGHAALINAARNLNQGPVVVTIFVNPAQFNEAADFDQYPRNEQHDAELCAHLGAHAIFAPSVETIYPDGDSGHERTRPLTLPNCVVNKGLEDAFRPGHFEGVYRVCRRLFELLRPTAATFGEKDWQQLKLVEAMSAAENLGVTVHGVPTVRDEGDRQGIALSSRNVHLKPEHLTAALGLSRAIKAAQQATAQGHDWLHAQTLGERTLRDALPEGKGFEYFQIRDADTCDTPRPNKPRRALCAARVGTTRLIDNDACP